MRAVYVDDLIQRWIVELVRATRDLDGVAIGASVRGTLALEHAARAFALLGGREFVIPADVDRLIVPVLCHRIAYTRDVPSPTPAVPAGTRRSTGSATRCSSGRRGRDARQRDRRRPGVSAAAASFPLVLRRRHVGLAFGATPSSRRGPGSDVAGSRPYRRGDAMRGIDWAASARLSAARSEDAFIVRERFADESPRVVDRRRPAARDGALPAPGSRGSTRRRRCATHRS